MGVMDLTRNTKADERFVISAFDFTKKRNWAAHFHAFDIARFEKLLREKGEDFWQRAGERRALRVFHETAERVPAYKDFLKKQRVRHEKIKTIQDFKQVPFTDKKNYISAYPLKKRCWDGEITATDLITVSSGTTGEPTFWPRGGFQEFEAAITHELIYRYLFEIDKYKTLLLIGFPMGVYVSGVATLLPSWLTADKQYDVTMMSVGNNKSEMLRAVKHVSEHYQQVVLIGHPFFVKDVIETGSEIGVRWSGKRLRMMFCSEGFSEEWREYIAKKAGILSYQGSIISTYGSTEMLLMAHETPLSIFARRVLEKDCALKEKLFGSPATPNLFQYNPFLRYIESMGKDLIFTSASGTPLVRFDLRDGGRLATFARMTSALDNAKPPDTEFSWQLPFLALWGRSDQTVIFYAANIYPEHIHMGLNHKPFLSKLTGKFSMRKGYLKNMDEFLEINVETRKGVKLTRKLAKDIQAQIIKKLREVNMEYLDASNRLDKDLSPLIKLWPYQHEKYFRPGLKPRYIYKD